MGDVLLRLLSMDTEKQNITKTSLSLMNMQQIL